MNHREWTILRKVIDEAEALGLMLNGVDEAAFLVSEEKTRAVCMTLINIGELVKNLDNDFRSENPQVPWKDMAGLRDVAAPGYFTLRMQDIWIYASIEMPMFASQITQILESDEKQHPSSESENKECPPQ